MLMMAFMILFGIGDAAAQCTGVASAAALLREMSLGEADFVQGEYDQFLSRRERIIEDLPCLTQTMLGSQVLFIYRMEAFNAYLNEDPKAAKEAFASMLKVSSTYQLSENYAPLDHPLQEWFDITFEKGPADEDRYQQPREGEVWIDGGVATHTPSQRPFLYQYLNEEGNIQQTMLVDSGGEVPRHGKGRRVLNMSMMLTATGGAILAGSSWILASQQEAQFFDPQTPDDQLDTLRRQTNTFTVLSISASAIAVSSGAVAILTTDW